VIVVDTNVIAYCWLNFKVTDVAQLVRRQDAEWRVPPLWRSEMRNLLAGFIRRKELGLADAQRAMALMEGDLGRYEQVADSADVLDLVGKTKLTAYDCEFVALAMYLDVPLITEDRDILKAMPAVARSMADFLG
jgi:predicted nucleic acid-binding protein